MVQNPLLVIIPVRAGYEAALQIVLEQMGEQINKSPLVNFKLTPSTHFARFVLLPHPEGGSRRRLYFSSNHDGTRAEYARELANFVGAGLDVVLAHCENYKPQAALDGKQLQDFLERHSRYTDVFWNATPGISVRDVLDAESLRRQVNAALNEIPPGATTPGPLTAALPSRLQEKISATLKQPPPKYNAALAAKPLELMRPQKDDRTPLFRVVEWLLGVRPGPPTAVKAYRTPTELAGMEDRVVQNQMTVVTPIKTRWLHRFFLPRLFCVVNRLLQHQLRRELVGIPTIHFARWSIIDNGQNLLFESNYDGSWDSYIDDFVDYAASWMNAIWMTCEGFPRGGTRDVEEFKSYIRQHQLPAQMFYSAYPETTMKNKLTDLALTDLPFEYLHPAGTVERFIHGNQLLPDGLMAPQPTSTRWESLLYYLGFLRCLWRPREGNA